MNLSAKRITIGRKPGNTIILNSSDVSGTHAALTLVNPITNTWEIQDMGSANGTYIDGLRIYRKEITQINQIKLGQTFVSWDVILDRKASTPADPVLEKPPVRPSVVEPSAQDEELREIAWSLKKVSDEFREKRNRIAEIQGQESLNSRISSIGLPIGGLMGPILSQVLPSEYKIFGFAAGLIPLGFALSAFLNSKKLSKEKKTYNGLDDWYKINYVCPHCHTFIQQPFELLEKTKSCRTCKKPLIP